MKNSFKKIVKQFVPPILISAIHCAYKKKRSADVDTLLKKDGNGNRLIVIGNGPSLNMTFAKYEKELCSTECLMVNESAMTPLYVAIKPCYYMLVDPKYYKDNGYEFYHKTLESLTATIVEKTTWQMKIIMPKSAKGSYTTERFKANSNLEVLYYEDGWQIPEGMTQFEAWDKNIIGPPAQTVLNTAVWLSIYWGYKETYLIGADTSFIQDIYVGQKDNVLYTVDTHFYKNKDVYDCDFEPEKHGRKFGMDMEKFLDSVYKMFQSYKELRQYADWKMVKVYNASEYSLIDCFERKKLR